MSAIPVISWLGREDEARLRSFAEARGESIERVAGDLLADALDRRQVAAVELPATDNPTTAEHEAARERARAEYALSVAGYYDPTRWANPKP